MDSLKNNIVNMEKKYKGFLFSIFYFLVILEYWMPFFHNSSGAISVQAMKVHTSLLNIVTVKDKIADTINLIL